MADENTLTEVVVNSQVTVRSEHGASVLTFTISDDTGSDSEMTVTSDSTIGEELLGKQVGDTITIHGAAGAARYQVTNIVAADDEQDG